MTTPELIRFVGIALLYAVAVTALAYGAARLAQRAWAEAAVPAMFLVSFFLALTHHPFPDPGTLDCSGEAEAPRLTPFQFLRAIAKLWHRDAPAGRWIHDLTVSSAAMNLILCIAIGAALAPLIRRAPPVLLLAAGLTGLVELSQLTGIFGIYDCAYRQFDVDDLILNFAGIAVGWTLARMFTRAR